MPRFEGEYDKEYKKLNPAQKQAVDTIDGPVMVVAGPGTGKTQILALRIGNILRETDVKADGILCLTFTNSAVKAMRERLVNYIGKAGEKVNIFTFHSFGLKLLEEHFKVLGMKEAPKLLEDTAVPIFFDEILSSRRWQYLRPRGDSSRYFKDLRSLISLLKRSRISIEEFSEAVEEEIESIKNDEGSVVSRGSRKGELKKEAEESMGKLKKSREVSEFLEIYEKKKKEENIIDYDDVLENMVQIMERSEDALKGVQERYLYVLVDEHQDSSLVQNEFLAKIWGDLERPDIFVVGDDRQLIYGFSGASIDHFKGFQKTFPKAKLIPLLQNYRSTQVILDAAHALLPSVFSGDKLQSQGKEHHPIALVEADDHEEEILSAALDIKEKIKKGVPPEECALLVPSNAQARRALQILHKEGLPVALSESFNFFEQKEGQAFLRILKILDSGDPPSLALSFFDEISGVLPLEAHEFIFKQNMKAFSLDAAGAPSSLFEENSAQKWLLRLLKWRKAAKDGDLKNLIETIGRELPGRAAVLGEDLAATLLAVLEKKPEITLRQFVSELAKAREYGGELPLRVKEDKGVRVLTMHSSKGLEFEYVWIAHMDERSLWGGGPKGFVLPEGIKGKLTEGDSDAVKRKLFVAITRAKRFCSISYARVSRAGREQDLARMIAELPKEVFSKRKAEVGKTKDQKLSMIPDLSKMVAKGYRDRTVSASMLNNFFECPWQWYFRNFLQLPQELAEVLEFGSAVHAAIERILGLPNPPASAEVKSIVSEEVGKTKIAGESAKERMAGEIFEIVERWVDRRLPEIKPSRKTEEAISIKDRNFPHLKIFGRIDLIENLAPGEIRVTDFKTGRPKRKSDIEKKDEEERMSGTLRQLAMYAYLLKNNPKWRSDVRECRLEFLEADDLKDALYDRVIGQEELDLLVKDIKDYDLAVQSGDWVLRECHYNSYGKNTECEYCKMAEIYLL